MTYNDVIAGAMVCIDVDAYGFNNKVWSSLHGPFCGDRDASADEIMQLRKQSRSHSSACRFDYPAYLLFVVPNTTEDKVELYFSPTPELFTMVLMAGYRPSDADPGDEAERRVRRRLLQFVVPRLDAALVRVIDIDTW